MCGSTVHHYSGTRNQLSKSRQGKCSGMSNFRQAYYGKLGYKGTEGKLEVLLDEKKVKDLNKLKLFAEYGLLDRGPSRLLLWGYLSRE